MSSKSSVINDRALAFSGALKDISLSQVVESMKTTNYLWSLFLELVQQVLEAFQQGFRFTGLCIALWLIYIFMGVKENQNFWIMLGSGLSTDTIRSLEIIINLEVSES